METSVSQFKISSSPFLLLHAPLKVSEEGSRGLGDSLLQDFEHPEKAISHASVQKNNSTSVTTILICPTRCLFAILYEGHLSCFFLERFIDDLFFYVSRFTST